VGIFNRHPSAMTARVDFQKLGFPQTVKAKDLWQAKDLGNIRTPYTVIVPGHGVLFLRVSQ
jgi:alpha-galactosidase